MYQPWLVLLTHNAQHPTSLHIIMHTLQCVTCTLLVCIRCLVYICTYGSLYIYYYVLQNIVESDSGQQVVAAPLLQLSAENTSRYGIFLMDCGMVHMYYTVHACMHIREVQCTI